MRLIKILTSRVLATEQPKVPEPNNRHLELFNFSKSISGSTRHFMSFKLRSIEFLQSLKEKYN